MNGQGRLLSDRYEIAGEIGKGGTSVVYKAYDRSAANAVRAIKEIKTSNAAYCSMADKESQLIKELYERDKSNGFFPNIIERFESEGYYYIVQDYIDGQSMIDVLEGGAMPKDIFLEAAKQICSFMKFFHDTGRVYSDMKPENIMVLRPTSHMAAGDAKKTVKLKFIDFGTSIKNETGAAGYTPEYAAPEQYNRRQLDERTDIFNIGATFYHMIQGRKPIRINGENRPLKSVERFRFDKNVNSEIKRLIIKCVSDDPEKRYKNCDALYRDICRIEKYSYLRIIALFFSMAVFCFGLSGFSAFHAKSLEEKNIAEKYTSYVNQGDYANAIKLDHTNRNDIYIDLINSFTADQKLDMEEDNFILNEISSRDDISPTDSDHGMIMYRIAMAYWLYFYPYDKADNGDQSFEKARIDNSIGWFAKAVEDENFRQSHPDEYAKAEIYYNIGKFYSEIEQSEREGTDDRAFYTELWEKLSQTAEFINDPNDVVSARVCQTLLSFISRYSIKFKQIDVRQSDQKAILDSIESKVYGSDGSITYSNTYANRMAEDFDLGAVRESLHNAYVGGVIYES